MSGEFDDLCTHSVTVETYLGSSGMGSRFAAPTAVPATGSDAPGVMVNNTRRLVRDANAAEVISESTISDPDVTRAALYAPGSRVTLPGGRVAAVISVKAWTAPGVDLPESLEVALT